MSREEEGGGCHEETLIAGSRSAGGLRESRRMGDLRRDSLVSSSSED